MRQGHRRDAEIDALCDYAKWVCEAAKAHPEDVRLIAFKRIVLLMVLQELEHDRQAMNDPKTSLVNDRLADCRDCDMEGGRTCNDPEKKHRCRWRLPEQKKEAVRRYIGEEAIQFLDTYKDVRTKGRA